MYHFVDRLHTLYGLLQDEQSKEIFQARFAIDMEESVPHLKRLLLARDRKWGRSQPQKKEILKKLNIEHNKIILYGTHDTGRSIAKILEFEHIDFYGFCGRGAERFHDGLLGKPVISPDELVAHGDEYYVLLAVLTKKAHTEISQFLEKHNYPKEHILDWVDPESFVDEKPYFEFPELYRQDTAFIDGGCYDCETSYRFAEFAGGRYSSIIAFEPDPGNYSECCKRVRDVPLPNFQLINAGLSSQEGTAIFDARNALSSQIIQARSDPRSASSSQIILAKSDSNESKTNSSNVISIRTVTIDDVVGDCIVGFIKMDIEGAELDALHGAKNTILRDKPLLAICVYHLRGDVFAIMDYLHQLLPEYRFWLRHYGSLMTETVLYASIDL